MCSGDLVWRFMSAYRIGLTGKAAVYGRFGNERVIGLFPKVP